MKAMKGKKKAVTYVILFIYYVFLCCLCDFINSKLQFRITFWSKSELILKHLCDINKTQKQPQPPRQHTHSNRHSYN
jgi:hypothetical protein